MNNMMLSVMHLYVFFTAAIITTILVPYVARLSVRFGGIDAPDERKVHSQATPRLGGIALFSSLLFTVIFFCDINQQLKGFLSGAIIIFLTGLADDLTNLSPRQKFAGEFAAAGLAVFMGDICVRHLGNPFGLGVIELGPLAVPFTLIGIVGLINAINLLDGLDGLAGGVCSIVCVAFAILSYTSGNAVLCTLSIALLGALLGFLRYNNYPAKIFMGDSGSLLLGYCMGIFSIMLATGGREPVSPYVPLILLGLPILDTLVVMVNRKICGKRMFMPDKTHLHHRLLDLGIGHKFTVMIVFGMSYLLSLLGIFGRNLGDGMLLLLFALVAAALYGILHGLISYGWFSRFDLYSNQSLRSTIQHRSLVRLTCLLLVIIKYLVIAILLLPVLLSPADISMFSLGPLLLLLVSAVFYFTRPAWQNTLLQVYIYVSGFFLIFIMGNYGRDELLLGIPLVYYSHALFLLLLVCLGIKIFIRKRASHLIVFPFEYLIMLIVLAAPMLPQDFTGRYHLMTVAAKSVILFLAFKLILMRQPRRNRKIILAIAVSTLVLAVRYVTGF